MTASTLGSALRDAAANAAEGIRLWDRQEQETLLDWRSLWERARRVAGGLRERGVRPGDTVEIGRAHV